ncbi:MAG: 30S ribosomal protein S3ae [Candidatus Thalassarchaeaceae archaeon]|jgi:small subunit ribosomal protein S3Ae|nr:30S ribosomal protein S3ae [Euryarchaeota archaeon]MDP6871463.1 30S ribosomal protein S3ae [Candidatus Thalassarchaeaceae archaeon]
MAKGAKARAAARRQRDKWKSKRWFSIRAPRNPWSFRVIGETLAEEPEMLIGRNFEIMQNELDGDFSKMHVKIRFRVVDVLGTDALTEFIGHQMMQDHIRRQIRRDRGKIDDTVDIVTEDGYYVRFKPLIITRERAKSSQKNEIRTIARNIILKTGASSTWVDMQKSVMDGELEAKIKEGTSKITPIRAVMIRRTQLIQSGVVVDDGPTLEEIHAQERADAAAVAEESDVLAAAEASADISEPSDDGVEDEAIGGDADNAQEQDNDDSEVDYSSLKVAELKELLKAAGKPVSGKKSDLIARLEE